MHCLHIRATLVLLFVTLLGLGAPLPSLAASACGGKDQRACCLGERKAGACDSGLEEKAGCSGDCKCGGLGLANSSGTCRAKPPPPTACGAAGQRACCLAERVPSCNAGLYEKGQCQGNCACGKGPGSSIGMCVASAKPIAHAGDFPPPASAKSREQRLTECKNAKQPDCYAEIEIPKSAGVPSNCLYGWAVGKGHPQNANPPAYDKLLNGMDQCAWFHDRGAWKFNRTTGVCEHWTMCSNTVGLKNCLARFEPKTPEETAAKACFTDNFEKIVGACVPALYQDWGAEFATDAKGDRWLTAKSVSELRGALKECPSPSMTHPGFPGL